MHLLDLEWLNLHAASFSTLYTGGVAAPNVVDVNNSPSLLLIKLAMELQICSLTNIDAEWTLHGLVLIRTCHISDACASQTSLG